MMEPVAWRVKDFADGWFFADSKKSADNYAETHGPRIEPLVRLSDAEARIEAERQAAINRADVELLKLTDDYAKEVERRVAAEALLKEAGPIIKTFAEIGDYVLAEAPADATMWYAGHSCTGEHMAQVSLDYFRAARAIRDKIGAKDE